MVLRCLPVYLQLLLLTAVLLLGACRSTRHVPEGRHLLVDNTIKADELKIKNDDLKDIIKQRPNRKILGLFRFHLGVYNLVAGKKEGKIRNYLKNTVGESPVLLDTALTERSARQLELYLKKKGYFNAVVGDSTVYHRKKAEVIYHITANEPYSFRKLSYNIEDSAIKVLVKRDSVNTLIRTGNNYDEDVISAERDRVTRLLNNEGYYDFSKEFIFFDADTSVGQRQVDLVMNISNPKIKSTGDTAAETISVPHKKYRINKIFINTDYKTGAAPPPDTLIVGEYHFLFYEKLNFKSAVLIQHTFLKQSDLYSIRNVEETYKKLNDLRVFRLTNIYFTKDTAGQLLNAHISLSPLIKQVFDIEPEAYFRSGQPGIAGNVIYTNRNIFKGAENLEIRFKASLEKQQVDEETQQSQKELFFFNVQEFGPEMTLIIPKFFPFKAETFSYLRPKTNLSAAYNYQLRPDLTRRIINLTYGYTARIKSTMHFIFNPLELNFVDVVTKGSLDDFLNRVSANAIIRRSFEPHVTAASRATFIYNNQNLKRSNSYFFFRGSLEGAGNLFYGLGQFFENELNKSLFNTNRQGSYVIYDTIPFAQYVKTDIDVRYYHIFHEKHNVAWRGAVGVGKALKNLPVLPLEKAYFAGGSNSIRAWAARTLGPGAFPDTIQGANTLRLGDISLETSLEYRFDLFKIIEGALFMDAGNIWLFPQKRDNANELTPLSDYRKEFDKSRLLSQTALGTGAGIRFDFSFFIFRFDTGLKLHDPAQDWVIKKIFDTEWKKAYIEKIGFPYRFHNFNIGIGYPF